MDWEVVVVSKESNIRKPQKQLMEQLNKTETSKIGVAPGLAETTTPIIVQVSKASA